MPCCQAADALLWTSRCASGIRSVAYVATVRRVPDRCSVPGAHRSSTRSSVVCGCCSRRNPRLRGWSLGQAAANPVGRERPWTAFTNADGPGGWTVVVARTLVATACLVANQRPAGHHATCAGWPLGTDGTRVTGRSSGSGGSRRTSGHRPRSGRTGGTGGTGWSAFPLSLCTDGAVFLVLPRPGLPGRSRLQPNPGEHPHGGGTKRAQHAASSLSALGHHVCRHFSGALRGRGCTNTSSEGTKAGIVHVVSCLSLACSASS
jgi:hypothetical protein